MIRTSISRNFSSYLSILRIFNFNSFHFSTARVPGSNGIQRQHMLSSFSFFVTHLIYQLFHLDARRYPILSWCVLVHQTKLQKQPFGSLVVENEKKKKSHGNITLFCPLTLAVHKLLSQLLRGARYFLLTHWSIQKIWRW